MTETIKTLAAGLLLFTLMFFWALFISHGGIQGSINALINHWRIGLKVAHCDIPSEYPRPECGDYLVTLAKTRNKPTL